MRFAADERAETTLAMLAECFELVGGVPKVVLADRMGCLKGGVVANVVVPTPAYVRFATHYRFRPDFCEGGRSRVEGDRRESGRLRQVRSDRAGRAGRGPTWTGRTAAARAWCAEVNARTHSRDLRRARRAPGRRGRSCWRRCRRCGPGSGGSRVRKVDRLSCVRIGSARYSVPVRLIGHTRRGVRPRRAGEGPRRRRDRRRPRSWSPPGEASVARRPLRRRPPGPAPPGAPRPVTDGEKAFCALGPAAEAFLRGAAAAGVTRLGAELGELAGLEAAHGRPALVSPPWSGRWRSGVGGPAMCAPSWPRAPALPGRPGPGEALVIPLPHRADPAAGRLRHRGAVQ